MRALAVACALAIAVGLVTLVTLLLLSLTILGSTILSTITNGVHASTWTSTSFATLYDHHLPGWRRDNYYLRYAAGIPLAEIRQAHAEAKKELLQQVRWLTGAQLDEKIFTIGFARRATGYKRGDLIFTNRDRLKQVASQAGSIQLIYAGKAHPRDEGGKAIIRRIFEAAAALRQEKYPDPIALEEFLARPGANVTGLSAAVTDIYPKRVQLIKELVPKAARIAVLFNMSNPALPPQWREVEKATRALGIEPLLLDVRKAEDLEPAFDTAVKQRADALVVGIETLTQANQGLIVDLAARRRAGLPLGSVGVSVAAAGGSRRSGVGSTGGKAAGRFRGGR